MFPKEQITSNPIPLILNTHLETMGLDWEIPSYGGVFIPHMRTMVLEDESQHLPVSKITQSYR